MIPYLLCTTANIQGYDITIALGNVPVGVEEEERKMREALKKKKKTEKLHIQTLGQITVSTVLNP